MEEGTPKATWISGVQNAMSEKDLRPGDWHDRKDWEPTPAHQFLIKYIFQNYYTEVTRAEASHFFIFKKSIVMIKISQQRETKFC